MTVDRTEPGDSVVILTPPSMTSVGVTVNPWNPRVITVDVTSLEERVAALETQFGEIMLSAFNEPVTVSPTPLVQIAAANGILTTDVIVTTLVGGTGTATSSVFRCLTTTTSGSSAIITSRRQIRYRAGQGIRARLTTVFPNVGVANSLQVGGMFSAVDGYFVGYNGTAFGLTRRIAGALEIRRLTITVGSGGAENITITLNGVAFVVASGGALSTTALAQLLAAQTTYTGWVSSTSPQSNGVTVAFIRTLTGAAAGAYSLASTGTAAGTFAQVAAGVANDDTTGFVPQASWSLDPLDGTGPSGATLVPSDLNAWQIEYGYLGIASTTVSWLGPDDVWVPVHRFVYASAATNQTNPTFRIGWMAVSNGSTSVLRADGASAAAFIDGPAADVRDPFSAIATNFTASTTERIGFAIRCRGDFASKDNLRDIYAKRLVVANETANRTVLVRVMLGGTPTGVMNWGYVNESLSCVETVTTAGVSTLSGAREIAATIIAGENTVTLDLAALDLRIQAGDTVCILLSTVSSTAICSVALNWQER